ncbi:2-aminoethylphosphonate--pyruvate transaminase [Bacillus xiapuensis]|uniref:2-aminoethylphosphonate--pyruvate transaminase n=1 Tax=Bacillus xiapuensis TaxID=2014075 RepID=UPI000C236C48|nr:2-aminoethylphosphonate--pyruvate transaminase [Bacillus xiapuensis]
MDAQHYLLLTPGPLTTTATVKQAMLYDWCTWDEDYNQLVQAVRKKLVRLAVSDAESYTAVLMQGSGTFTVEAAIGTVLGPDDQLLVCANGAYGQRIARIASILNIPFQVYDVPEYEPLNAEKLQAILEKEKGITHVAAVHCETTTGLLNPIKEIAAVAKRMGKVMIVDAMSSFGGIEIEMERWQVDFLISSANKCIQGVPGFGFVIAKRSELEKCKENARSLSLDLYDQWNTMEKHGGKWRFTSPTHAVHAFYQALLELEDEGGVLARQQRYARNQQLLVERMEELGFLPFIDRRYHSPIITSFLYPSEHFSFENFYQMLKRQGFVIYPGKVSQSATFRIGNIGDVHEKDIILLTEAIQKGVFIQ